MNKSGPSTSPDVTSNSGDSGNNAINHQAGSAPLDPPAASKKKREYEKSGLYPENGKAFRVWALLGVLAIAVLVLAGVSALINIIIV